jgi:formyltetrahydrofolate deformylase
MDESTDNARAKLSEPLAVDESGKPLSLIAMLFGPDRRGLVARVAGWIYDHGGNILHADQHRDAEENVFFQRIEWTQPGDLANLRNAAQAFSAMARETLGMNCRVAISSDQPRVGVLVSKIPHCLQDVAYRWKRHELPGQLVCVISNHQDLGPFCQSVSLPFHQVESLGEKSASEEAMLRILQEYKVDLLVLARYMQILSPEFLETIGVPVINVHHSFLPAFPGSRPYHQAYARGVKVIGATAHYVTTELDAGPIITQDVARISHRHTVADLIRRGQDLECSVFAQAIRWHLENRVLVYNNKTVVFD